MWESIKNYIFAHTIGLCLLLTGWYISVLDTALDRFSKKAIISSGTTIGLLLIVVGAYLPEVWMAIVKKSKSKKA